MNKVLASFAWVATLVVLMQCSTTPQESRVSRWQPIASTLMERIDLQAGERVLIMAAPGDFDTLINLLTTRVTEAGGEFLGVLSVSGQQPADWSTDYTRSVPGDVSAMTEYFANVDLGIMMPGALATHDPYIALQEVLRSGTGRTIHFHWAGAYDVNGKPLAINDSISTFYYNTLLQTDYKALSRLQQKFETSAQGKRITVTDPNGTNLSFEITGRPVTKQDGDASLARTTTARNLIDREIELPAGAIRVAPLEETVNGTIAFPPSQWGEVEITGLKMKIEAGKVTEITAPGNVDAVNDELRRGGEETARSFREFVIGLNPTLVPPNRSWIPYYGYGAGVVRLSLGNNSELGGNVSGSPYVRWNFFTNTTVTVGDETWVKDGELMITE